MAIIQMQRPAVLALQEFAAKSGIEARSRTLFQSLGKNASFQLLTGTPLYLRGISAEQCSSHGVCVAIFGYFQLIHDPIQNLAFLPQCSYSVLLRESYAVDQAYNPHVAQNTVELLDLQFGRHEIEEAWQSGQGLLDVLLEELDSEDRRIDRTDDAQNPQFIGVAPASHRMEIVYANPKRVVFTKTGQSIAYTLT